ncbi:TFIIH/NER complex subunit TFB4 [Rhodotorula paludigena]|uniref:TFIIH/NER complex subunit TFB4 n=1 Tax=Rhodotorula paludigena TaxID=86838 RepID=UPI003179C390
MAGQGTTGDLLCLILDLNPVAWAQCAQQGAEAGDALSLEQALDHTLVFCNAHLALRHENEIAVFGAGPGRSRQLFSSQLAPTSAASTSTSAASDSNIYQQFRIVDERLTAGVKEMMGDMPEEPDGGSNLVGALSMALCHINRLNSTDAFSATSAASRKTKPRIVVLSVTPDASSQYVPIMNCIFTAQKNNIQIDVCKVYGPDAVFLQQASHLTSGAYYKLERRAALLQYLLMAFLPGPLAHKNLAQPKQEQVDLRAACFCHRRIVDIGYVCSVCLSIFCSPLPVCSTCRTKFPMSTLKRLGFGARPGGGGAGLPRPKKRKAPPAGTGAAATGAGPDGAAAASAKRATPAPAGSGAGTAGGAAEAL